MLLLIGIVAGGVIVALAVLGAVYFVGMRSRSPAVLEVVRRFSRSVVNPRMLKTAGTPGAYASVVRHVGRTTGREYRTPVVAVPADDGFVIALPYGATVNWVRNVRATGSATLLHEGSSYRVDRPEVVPLAPMNRYFDVKDQRSHVRFRVAQCLRLRQAGPAESPTRTAEAGAEATTSG